MQHGLAQTTPALYEPALSTLGTLLGAAGAKPPGKGRCDSAWSWQDCLWLAIEAKSDEKPSGMIPHRDIRQANDQLRLLCADRHQDAPPAGSATIIVSPKPAVARDGIISAEAHVHVISPVVMTDLARDAAQAWDEILAGRAGHSGTALRELVTAALARHSVLPSQVLDNPEGNGTLVHHRVEHRAVWPASSTSHQIRWLRIVTVTSLCLWRVR